MKERGADREDEDHTARPYSEADRQGEHIFENDRESDEDGAQRRERVETGERWGDG